MLPMVWLLDTSRSSQARQFSCSYRSVCSSPSLVSLTCGDGLVHGRLLADFLARGHSRYQCARHFHDERKSVQSRYAVRSQRVGGLG
jgi:hypothetical protein